MKSHFIKTNIISLLSITMLFYSCSDEIHSKIVQINYGTSFGECVGYCKHQMTLKQDSIIYNCSGWTDQIMPLSFNENLSRTTWDSIRVHLNTKAFFDLPKVIGCPDCADGGAEWLEVKLTNGDIHKVTYEYNNEPNLLKNYIPTLRKKLTQNKCK